MTTKAELHHLIDLMPDNELPAVQGFLNYVYGRIDPVLYALNNAPFEEEPIHIEEEQQVQLAREELARGEISAWEEAKQRLLRRTL